jgi:16S rRNA (uracil1498-N3)-methyltransferase
MPKNVSDRAPDEGGELAPPYAALVHSAPLIVGDTFALEPEALRGLAFREVNPKEAFTIVDRDGATFRASLIHRSAETGEAVVYEKMKGSTESPARIVLVCAVLARQRMIFVAQKATELGCTKIVPALTAKSVPPKDLDHEKPWAWPGQARKAARQCRRASVPEVTKVTPLARVIEAPFWREASRRFFLDDRAEGGGDPLAASGEENGLRDIVLVVGPEGGFSDEERTLLARAGATSLTFGTRVLRAETAVVAGLAILQHRLGDLT